MWESTEIENLLRDRNRKLEIIEIDKEFLDNEQAKQLDEEEKHVEETISLRDDLDTEELKELHSKEIRIHFIAKLFKENEQWRHSLLGLRDFTVIKMPRVLQSVFYLLQYERHTICEPESNKFFWKRAKQHLNEDLLHRMSDYKSLGPKEQIHQRYQTLNFIEKNIEGINPEDVDAYHMTLGKLFRWLSLAIRTRKEDIVRRKALKKRTREERENLLLLAEQLVTKREQDLLEAEERFKEEHKDDIEAAFKAE